MIRAVGETVMDHHCEMGTIPADCNVSTPYLIRSVADVCKKILFILSMIFYSINRVQWLSFVLANFPQVISRCCLNVNMEIIPGMLTLPLSLRHNTSPPLPVSPVSPVSPLCPLSLAPSESLQVSQLLCDTRPVNTSQTLTHHNHDTQVRIIKKIVSQIVFWKSRMRRSFTYT